MMKNRWFVIFMGVFLTFLPGGLYLLLAEMLGKYSPWMSFLAVVLGLFIGSTFVSRRYPDSRRDISQLIWIIFVSIVAISLVHCSQPPPGEQLKTIVQSSPSCTTPCWNGIVPGKSNEDDFLMLVGKSNPMQFANLERSEIPYKSQVGFTWRERASSLQAAILIKNDVVSFLRFMRTNELALEMLFDSLGNPNAYTAEISSGEAYLFDMNLFYEEIGMVVNIRIVPFDPPSSAFSPTCQINITTSMVVRAIYFAEPGTANELLETLYPAISSYTEPEPWLGVGLIPLTSCQ